MANVRQLRRRVRSVQTTAKGTRAMQMIAASKMRRAQERVSMARPYANKIREMIAGVASSISHEEEVHPLLSRRPVNSRLIVHITPDRGLAGGLPTNVNKAAVQFLKEDDIQTQFITVGKKGRDLVERTNVGILADYSGMSDKPSLSEISPIIHQVEQLYTNMEIDRVDVIFTKFINTLQQEAVVEQLLPVDIESLVVTNEASDISFEPSSAEVLNALLPRFLESQLYQSILEAQASEQSARMVAMRNATDAAEEMIDTLTLEMNKVRQESITNELLDLVGGVAALEG